MRKKVLWPWLAVAVAFPFGMTACAPNAQAAAVQPGIQAPPQAQSQTPAPRPLTAQVISASILRGQGIPAVDPDYDLSVADWWARHPLNPAAPSGIPVGGIKPFANVVSVKPGDDLQAIIDRYRDRGVTIQMSPGVYNLPIRFTDPSDPSAQFSLVTRGYSNIQFVADEPGTVTIQGRILVSASQFATPKGSLEPTVRTYGQSIDCVFKPDQPHHDFCRQIQTRLPGNIYFKNITFDGNKELASPLVNVRTARDVVFDSVVAQNSRVNEKAHHPGLIEVASGVNNVWVRNSRFVGSNDASFAVYMDGVHGGGVLGSTVEGSFLSGGFLFLTNDDFTNDINPNAATFDERNLRNSQFVVVSGNTFGSLNTAVAVTAAHTLIENNEVKSLVNNFFFSAGRCSNRYPGRAIYPNTDHLIRGNRINKTDNLVTVDAQSMTNCRRTDGVGRVTVLGNKIRTVTQPSLFFIKGPEELVVKPLEEKDNCVGDKCY